MKLSHGMDHVSINPEDSCAESLLHMAVWNEREPILVLLLDEHDIQINRCPLIRWKPLRIAAVKG